MVEIKRSDVPSSPEFVARRPDAEDDKHRLLYTRSKVYVHPTAYARDNIPGFVALVKREATNAVYFLAWIPESLLNEKGVDEWKKFTKIEESSTLDEEDDGAPHLVVIRFADLPSCTVDVVFIDLPNHRPESYAFSVPLTSIYSLIMHPPSLSSWYGSMAINLINGDTLPTLHFHDDESRSFTAPTPKTPQSIDPSKADMETHTTQIFDDDAVDDILAQSSYANSHSPKAAPTFVFTSIAESVLPAILSSPQKLVNVNGETEWGSWVEKGGVGEFESARVYLARWARIVAEEGERARRREAQSLPSSSASNDAEETSLGVFELLHSAANLPTPKSSRDPAHPIDETAWEGWFSKDGRPRISEEEMKGEVFRRGISPRGHLRRKLWPFVLGVHGWDVTSAERAKQWLEKSDPLTNH
ncbi:GTPase activating protein [Salix suchowensis]|nr:GTPase activating protein [Salix suchowensis]